MSAACFHDKQKLKSFWEKRVAQHSELMDEEETRVRSSALAGLRKQWLLRLAQRNQNQQDETNEKSPAESTT
ncbi:uncharacterized protein LOC142988259 [Genypterus blacodes]|uniref:uncharacterized protein LOC142988259 n=1 Tax=Genypterus blacodes TaxID=154954 RepID=UPI003F7630D2